MREGAEAGLMEAVAAHPNGGCALMRLANHVGLNVWCGLTRIAQGCGFSPAEAEGIMDGWDVAAGASGCHTPVGLDQATLDEYDAGYRLGVRAFNSQGGMA